jgi:iron complex transport system ATP-binding protein
LIKLREVSVTYRGNLVEALKNITTVIPGNVVSCIMGPNASGKTTMLKAIAQLVDYEGRIEFNEKDAKEMVKTLRRMLSYVSAIDVRELLGVTVLDLLIYSRYPISEKFLTTMKDIEESVKTAETLNIKHLLHRKVNELSSGELQRVLLASALVRRPEILLLDEPESHLDMRSKIWLSGFLKSISNNATIVLSTHDPYFASLTCDYLILLSKGRLVFSGTREHLLQNPEVLEEVYNTPFTTVKIGGYEILVSVPLES